jgi:hypothetical protein
MNNRYQKSGCPKTMYVSAARCGDFIFPLALTATCGKIATFEKAMRDVGGGTHPAPIVCGRRTSYGVHDRLLKNAHLQRSPNPSSLRRTFEYASLLRISGALHLSIFEQPEKRVFEQALRERCESK